MSRPAQRVVLFAVIAIGILIALYPHLRAGERMLPGIVVRPEPPNGSPMPTYRPAPGTTEQMPTARSGMERVETPQWLDSVRRAGARQP